MESTTTRREWLRSASGLFAAAALRELGAAPKDATAIERAPHVAPKAKQALFLFQSGGPSHLDLWDWKPELARRHGEELPASVRGTQRVTGMTSGQAKFLVNGPIQPFRRHGRSGRWVSDLLPYTARLVDRLCVLKAVHTEAINHDPGITFFCTGSQQVGHPSLGAWLSYGLGSENRDLPAFVVLVSQGTGKNPGQPIFARLWGSGFLPSEHQGVQLRSGASPVLHLQNPPGVDRPTRRAQLDALRDLNAQRAQVTGDPETAARIAQYELAYRMQASVPELADLRDEPEETFRLYGEDARTPGTYAANCLLARRLLERGVRFVQLFHRGWDQHDNLVTHLGNQCRDTDRATAALVFDLERRGLLDQTVVAWGGEFGRTAYSQGALHAGRDHHGRCFSTWLAGAGIRAGIEHGETDDFGYNIVRDGVHVHELQATLLHCLGLDHRRLTFPHQGLAQRLTGVEPVEPVRAILA
ncbi:MAG: DUF1501 domain-containing protein [Planctomycetes bacterium]|nr:DUF1501 domain-containing protein [Planctomycetota bacterium]